MYNKLNNQVVAILSYANDQKKLDILDECISVSKSHGYKVILSSAIDVPSYITEKVDYLVIDKENPVIKGEELSNIGGAIFYNLSYPSFTNSYCIDMNHSYAVLKLIKNAASIAQINGFDAIHYINYDYIINDESVFIKHNDWLTDFDLIYYYFVENVNFMNTGFFSIKTSVIIDCFKSINSKNDFCKRGLPILEEYMLSIFRERNLNLNAQIIQQLEEKNKLDLISTQEYLISKKVNREVYNFFLFLSFDINLKSYFIITLSNLETEVEVEIGNIKSSILVTGNPRIFKVDESMLDNGINFNVIEFNHIESIDRNKKVSTCNIIDYSIVEDIHSIFESDLSSGDFYKLCIKNGTDKVHYHGYNYFYPQYIEKFRNQSFNFLEIGYGNGKSLPVWLEYFPKADITIADINFEEVYSDRCRVIKCDQSNQDDLVKLTQYIQSVKLVIDDGSHNPVHQLNTFEFLFKNLLEPGGVYIIEDIELSYWNPESSLYGYKSGQFNIVHYFKKYQEMINSEFTGVDNYLDISTITFAQNSIIVTKRTSREKNYFSRTYRFQDCINGVCSYT